MRRFNIVVLLALTQIAMAQQFNMPKQQWLTRLKPIMSQGFCKGADSPFMQIYKGTAESCVADVEKLFDYCVTSEPAVVLPDALRSVPQANWYGQVMGECISAHYQGGVVLEAFRALQRTVTPPKDVVARGENAEESARAYADKMATLISQGKEDELLVQFVTAARAVSDKSSLLKPLAELRQARGAILKYEYRNKVQGRTMFPGEVLPTLTYWYALESERGVENDFLTITIAPEGANLGLVSFRVATIVGPLPGFLEPKQHK